MVQLLQCHENLNFTVPAFLARNTHNLLINPYKNDQWQWSEDLWTRDLLCFVIECRLSLESARDIGIIGIMGRLCMLMSSPSFTSYASSDLPGKHNKTSIAHNKV